MSVPGKRTVSLRELLQGTASSILVRGSDLTPVSPRQPGPTPLPTDIDTPSKRKKSSFFDDDDDDGDVPSPSTAVPSAEVASCSSPRQRLIPTRLTPFLLDEEDYLFDTRPDPSHPIMNSKTHRQGRSIPSDSQPSRQRTAGDRSLPRDEATHVDLDTCVRPVPQQRNDGPMTALRLPGANGMADSEVNLHLAGCLLTHQITGVLWLWEKYCLAQGCILGDDMGLGKTVQVISLLCGILRKSGTSTDLEANRLRRRNRDPSNLTKPSLIVCPASVIDNWKKELDKWGFFLYQSIESSEFSETMARAAGRRLDIVLSSYDKMKTYCDELALIEWEIVVWDEGHCLKNEKMARYEAAIK